MRCILIKDGKGPAENLYLGEEETPEPKQGQVLVKIKVRERHMILEQLSLIADFWSEQDGPDAAGGQVSSTFPG